MLWSNVVARLFRVRRGNQDSEVVEPPVDPVEPGPVCGTAQHWVAWNESRQSETPPSP